MPATAPIPNDLESYWMPFTPNRAFKRRPRMIARAKDMHYFTPEGRAVLDGTAGLWCTNAGHNRDPIVAAIKQQAEELDYSPAFQYAHPKSFELASRVAALAPGDLNRVFFCNSGSEAVDTALKIALAYHNVRGEGGRTRLIGRERGYHGVGFGGISVGGIVNNRKMFGSLLAGVDHLPATYNREQQAFTKGEPDWGAHLADELERIVALHDASTIAAVIVEPMAGSTGVLPPPKGYLEKLRAICDKSRPAVDLRRSDHRLRPPRLRLCRRALWRASRHDHVRQGHHLGRGADGRRDRARRHLRDLHARARTRHRAVPRLHLFGASACLRRGRCDARSLSRGRFVRARQGARAGLCRCGDDAQGSAERARHPHRRPERRHRSRLAAGQPGLRAYEAMERGFHEAGRDDPRHRRDDRAVAAADRERSADRRDFRAGSGSAIKAVA